MDQAYHNVSVTPWVSRTVELARGIAYLMRSIGLGRPVLEIANVVSIFRSVLTGCTRCSPDSMCLVRSSSQNHEFST